MFVSEYLKEVSWIADKLNHRHGAQIQSMIESLWMLRERKGRLFILGIGGSAANASHMVNDLRKICNVDAYAPTDNVSELTARVNDEEDGWADYFATFLKTSNFGENDAIFVLSVSGCAPPSFTSGNLVNASRLATTGQFFGIIGNSLSDLKFLKTDANILVVPELEEGVRRFPHSEEFQAVIWHLIVSHPIWTTPKRPKLFIPPKDCWYVFDGCAHPQYCSGQEVCPLIEIHKEKK